MLSSTKARTNTLLKKMVLTFTKMGTIIFDNWTIIKSNIVIYLLQDITIG